MRNRNPLKCCSLYRTSVSSMFDAMFNAMFNTWKIIKRSPFEPRGSFFFSFLFFSRFVLPKMLIWNCRERDAPYYLVLNIKRLMSPFNSWHIGILQIWHALIWLVAFDPSKGPKKCTFELVCAPQTHTSTCNITARRQYVGMYLCSLLNMNIVVLCAFEAVHSRTPVHVLPIRYDLDSGLCQNYQNCQLANTYVCTRMCVCVTMYVLHWLTISSVSTENARMRMRPCISYQIGHWSATTYHIYAAHGVRRTP